MSELILNTKRNIINYLNSHLDLSYCEVVPDWIAENQEKPFEKPIIVVQPINADTGEMQSGSLYAKGNWVDMRFNVDVWTDKKTGGTIERDRIASALFDIFNFKGVNEFQIAHGIKSVGITGGTPIFEPEPQIYRCRMVLEVSALMQGE